MNCARILLPALALVAACSHAPGAGASREQPASQPAAQAPAPPAPAIAAAPASPPPAAAAPRAAPAPAPARAERPPQRPAGAAAASAPLPAARPQAAALGPGEYFPLAVGNEWVYVDQSPALPLERRGTRRTVRILDRAVDGFFRDNERGELRVDGECVRDRVRRLLCQPFQEGATWSSVVSVTSTERYEIAGANESVDTPAGRFDRCVRVRAHNRATPTTDHVLEITYAPKVGPVRIETYVVVSGRATPQVKAFLQSYRVDAR
jgi:hypothetical protein